MAIRRVGCAAMVAGLLVLATSHVPARADPPAAEPARRASRQRLRVEWITLRLLSGVTTLRQIASGDIYTGYSLDAGWHVGATVTLFTLRWPQVYWDPVRVGIGARSYRLRGTDFFDDVHATTEAIGGRGYDVEAIWGTAVGYPLALDAAGRHELRFGVHLTFLQNTWPGYSGFELIYQHRTRSGFRYQLGLRQTSVPFGVLLTLGIGR